MIFKETRLVCASKIVLFAVILLGMGMIGLAFFARPSYSDRENRELTPFPALTAESFFNGEFFKGIDKWYADTFPCREFLIGISQKASSLYGFRSERVIGGDVGGEEIPDDPTPTGADDPISTPEPTAEPAPDADDGKGEKINNLYVVGDTAYELYGFNRANADAYASLISRAAQKLDGIAAVYDIVTPLAYSVSLSAAAQSAVGASDCEKAIDYLYKKMDGKVQSVSVYPILAAHRGEYLYFRTDHHWTSLGAYYAYTAFCEKAGLTPTALSDYVTVRTYEDFLGTLYSAADQPAAMAKNPDVVVAYVPNATNDITIYFADGTVNSTSYGVINRVSNTSNKYLTFLNGDNPLSTVHNPNRSDGSSILVIKESYGNAFVPFLVDQYEDVYILDYRHFSAISEQSLTEFVTENGIGSVLFINTLSSTGSSARLGELSALIDR